MVGSSKVGFELLAMHQNLDMDYCETEHVSQYLGFQTSSNASNSTTDQMEFLEMTP